MNDQSKPRTKYPLTGEAKEAISSVEILPVDLDVGEEVLPGNGELIRGKRHPTEPDTAVFLCNVYLRMGMARSLKRLSAYVLKSGYDDGYERGQVATSRRFQRYSKVYNWQARAKEYDEEKQSVQLLRDKQIMNTGFALASNRVQYLDKLAKVLLELVDTNLVVTDTYRFKGKEYSNTKYNAKLVDNIRGVLDDIAREVGGRVARSDVQVKGLFGVIHSKGLMGIDVQESSVDLSASGGKIEPGE